MATDANSTSLSPAEDLPSVVTVVSSENSSEAESSPSVITKACTTCGQTKPLSEFPGRGDYPQSLRPFCRACDHAHREEKRRNNKEKTLIMLDVLDEYGLDAWDLLPEENTQAYAAFCVYRDMWVEHPTRRRPTIPQTAEVTGWSTSAIIEWRSQFLWETRVEAFLREVDRDRREIDRIKYIQAMDDQRDAAKSIHVKAMQGLDVISPHELTPRETTGLLRLAASLTQETFKLLPLEEIELKKPAPKSTSEVTINQVSATEVTVGESTVRTINHAQDTVTRAMDILRVLQAANALPDSFGTVASSDYTDVYSSEDDDDDRPE